VVSLLYHTKLVKYIIEPLASGYLHKFHAVALEVAFGRAGIAKRWAIQNMGYWLLKIKSLPAKFRFGIRRQPIDENRLMAEFSEGFKPVEIRMVLGMW